MNSTVRLSQARTEALSDVLADLSDVELSQALESLVAPRALEVARTGVRGARLVARRTTSWADSLHAELMDLWVLLADIDDRVGLDALVATLPGVTLVAALRTGRGNVTWETLDARLVNEDDRLWLGAMEASAFHAQLIGAAAARDQWGRVLLAMNSSEVDDDAMVAHLAASRPVDVWLAKQLDARYEWLLARFGRREAGRISLPLGPVADAEAARVLAKSSHVGLRRVAASAAASDSLIRARLLGDDDPALDAALCSAPLNASEISQLVERLRRRPRSVREAERLLFQPEPLSTKDRLWLLRAGRAELTRAWVAGQSAQSPRSGEIEMLVQNPGHAFIGEGGEGLDPETMLAWAHDTTWEPELVRALSV